MNWDLKITLFLGVLCLILVLIGFGCDKKCDKGEVKMNGKCYVPGAYYNGLGQRVL